MMSVPSFFAGAGSTRKLFREFQERVGEEADIEITADWSGFDYHVPEWLIREAFAIIKSWFSPHGWLVNGKEVQFSEKQDAGTDRVWEFIVSYFINTPVMLPNGKVVRKSHGVPSGTMFTQAVDTLINAIVIRALFYYREIPFHSDKYLGDDSKLRVPWHYYMKHGFQVDQFAQDAKYFFGFELKIEKLRVSKSQEDRKFLGYSIHSGRYIRSSKEWFLSALYTEKNVVTLEKSASRMVAYYLLGGVNDSEFCHFFWEYFRLYPGVARVEVNPRDLDLKRLKKVFGTDVLPSGRIRVSKLDPFGSAYLMSLGTRPFVE